MAIQMVSALVDGRHYMLTYNPQTGAYEGQAIAPHYTSYNQPGGYYNVSIEVTNTAGTTVTKDGSDFDGLRLVVVEKVAPVITIISPTNGALVTNANIPVVFTARDEAYGSGIDVSSLVVTLDGAPVASSEITSSAITDGYQFTYTPAAALSNASHTVTIDISDNDGNEAVQKSITFTVDTVPPSLNVTSPTEGLITNNASLTVAGTTNDVSSSPVTVTITLNGADQGSVPTTSDGSFSKAVTLAEGANVIIVTAADTAGNVTTVTRNVTLDTSVPVILSANITPNPVDAGTTMLISVVIE